MKAITLQTPSGDKLEVTLAQYRKIKAGTWRPKNSQGEEYCIVYRGLHSTTDHPKGWQVRYG